MLPTATNAACADEILDVYLTSKTSTGAVAFAGENPLQMEPAYAWATQLLAGLTHAEVQDAMNAMRLVELTAPHGATQTIGTHAGLDAWIRIYAEQREVIRAARIARLRRLGRHRVAARCDRDGRAGSPASRRDHVVGIRSLVDDRGRLTSATSRAAAHIPTASSS